MDTSENNMDIKDEVEDNGAVNLVPSQNATQSHSIALEDAVFRNVASNGNITETVVRLLTQTPLTSNATGTYSSNAYTSNDSVSSSNDGNSTVSLEGLLRIVNERMTESPSPSHPAITPRRSTSVVSERTLNQIRNSPWGSQQGCQTETYPPEFPNVTPLVIDNAQSQASQQNRVQILDYATGVIRNASPSPAPSQSNCSLPPAVARDRWIIKSVTGPNINETTLPLVTHQNSQYVRNASQLHGSSQLRVVKTPQMHQHNERSGTQPSSQSINHPQRLVQATSGERRETPRPHGGDGDSLRQPSDYCEVVDDVSSMFICVPRVAWIYHEMVHPNRWGFKIMWQTYNPCSQGSRLKWRTWLAEQCDIVITTPLPPNEELFLEHMPRSWIFHPHMRYHLYRHTITRRVEILSVGTLYPRERLEAFANLSLDEQRSLGRGINYYRPSVTLPIYGRQHHAAVYNFD